jgi:hypothetical protein
MYYMPTTNADGTTHADDGMEWDADYSCAWMPVEQNQMISADPINRRLALKVT